MMDPSANDIDDQPQQRGKELAVAFSSSSDEESKRGDKSQQQPEQPPPKLLQPKEAFRQPSHEEESDNDDDVDGATFDDDTSSSGGSVDSVEYDGTGPPTWTISTKKVLGRRVYAEYSNGEAYWGNIVGVTGTSRGKNLRYKVLYEDGEVLGNLPEENVITEKKYIDIFNGKYPPYPRPKKGKLRKMLREARNTKKKTSPSRSISSSATKKQKIAELASFSQATAVAGAPVAQPPHESGETTETRSTAARVDLTRRSTPSPPAVKADRAHWYSGQLTDSWNPRKLFHERCKTCHMCTKKDCGLCASCLRSHHRYREKHLKEICFHRMCSKIAPQNKAQRAVGFPPGYAFYFEEHLERSFSQSVVESEQDNAASDVPGLHIIAPNGRIFSEPYAAAMPLGDEYDAVHVVQQFNAYVGLSHYHSDPHHFLVGRGYCCEWTHVNGQRRVIYGKISTCFKTEELPKFLVEYSEESRRMLDSMPNSAYERPMIPSTEKIACDTAWGGCVTFERNMLMKRGPGSVLKNLDRTMPCLTIVVPDLRVEKFVEYNGVTVPELTLIVRGYKLVFSVKTSTISNAGFGVFVTCTSLSTGTTASQDGTASDQFQLMAGELLDLGVYAPFLPGDTKHECVFNCKTYCFSMKTENYGFNCPNSDYTYDISDDKTGEPHDIARQHIPMYFNETTVDAETVHAEFDPEGAVHYLMGIRYHGDWEAYCKAAEGFILRADGSEVELFVNYGNLYEHVRIREGYSTLPASEKEKVLASFSEHEAGFVKDVVDHFDAREVVMCINFFLKRCMPEGYYGEGGQGKHIDGELRDRALRIARKLRIRAELLFKSVEASQTVELSPGVPRFDESQGIDLRNTMLQAELLIERLSRCSCHRKLKSAAEMREEDEAAQQALLNQNLAVGAAEVETMSASENRTIGPQGATLNMEGSNPPSDCLNMDGEDSLDESAPSDSDSSYEACEDFELAGDLY